MIRIFIIFMLFLSAQIARADEESDKAEFKKLYAEFNDLYANSKEIDPIIEVAEKLYKLAPRVYGQNDPNTAATIYNLATLYDEKGGETSYSDDEKKASDLYKEYFNIQDNLDAEKNAIYLDQYIRFVLAEFNASPIESKDSYSKKAIDIAKDIPVTNIELANLEYIVGILKAKSNKPTLARKYLEQAKSKYISEYNENDVSVARITFWLAKIDMALKKFDNAEKQFLNSIDILHKNKTTDEELLLSSHAFLVQLYEQTEQSDKATLHCQAVAVERPKDFDAYIEPLYRAAPEYPYMAASARKDGYVLVNFTVDTDGITRNIEVLESSDPIFEPNSIKAVEKFRFAPTVKDGELVVTEGVKTRMKFNFID